MAVDGGYGPKGYPKFDPNGAPEDWVDLEAVGAFAGKVGNRMVGTAAERAALSTSTTVADQLWVGLEFWESDTGDEWRYEAAGWVRARSKPVLFGTQSGSQPRARYWVENGHTHLSGVMAKGAGFALGSLPAGFRPSANVTLLDGRWPGKEIIFYSTGAIEYSDTNAGDVHFNHRFPNT